MKSATQPKLSVVIRFILVLLLCGCSGRVLASERIAIAIVPPHNLSRDTNTDHWQYTLPGLFSGYLASVKRIKECPESSLHFALHELKRHRGDSLKTVEVQKVGEILEARWVLFGSYKQESNQLTLTMQAMNVATGIISQKRTASGAARMKVLLEVAEGILRDLGVTPSAEEEQKMKQGPTHSEEALEFLSRAYADIQLDRPMQACEQDLRRATAIDPKSPTPQMGLSHILLLENRLDEAEVAAKLAVTNRPDYAAGHQVLGQVYFIKGLMRAACDEALEATQLAPDDGDYQMFLASIYSKLGKTREATSAMEQAESLEPYNPQTHAGLSLMYSGAGERDKALKEANLSERYCTGADGADEHSTACAFDNLNEVAKAVEHYEKFVSLEKGLGIELPDLKGDEKRLAQLKATLTPHFVAATAPRDFTPAELKAALKGRLTPGEYVLATNPLSCTPEMAKWAKRLTGDAKKPEEKARKLFETLARHLSHEHARMERTATQVFKAWPDEKESFTCQENTLLYLALARSIGLKAYFVYINRDFASNVVDHACVGAFFNGKALLIDPSYGWFGVPHQEYHFYNDFEAVGLYLMQKPDVPSREVAVKLIPDFPTAYFNLASRLAETNQLSAARAALDEGLKLDSQSWHALLVRAEVEGYEKNFGEAEKHLQAALALNPGFNSAHYLLGTTWLQDGMKLKEAREEYRKYLQGETDPVDADNALKALASINASSDDTNTQAVPDRNAFEATKAKAGKGDAEAQYILGVCYANGRGVPKDESEAVKWYRKAADQNHADAQCRLGACYEDGQGVNKDYPEAVKWYRKAADQNEATAQYNLGSCYYSGQGVPKDQSEAVKWYRKAADQNEADAQYTLGVCYVNGQGVTKEESEAVKWYRKAADQNNADAQYTLGVCYVNGQGVAKDEFEAVKWYRKAADQNHADAQYELGICYYYGQGVNKDESEAVKWYRKAADQNHADAQCRLGYCYGGGQGVTKDESEAVKWYRKAADQNYADAQYELGVCYYYGQGVSKDESEAVKWYRKAADQNHTDAQCRLGYCYEGGQGVNKDYAEAVKWYRKSADQDNATAQYDLGSCYYSGRGVPKDQSEAVKWYRKAADQNEADAQDMLGLCYFNGQGLSKDYSEAVKWYRKSADQNEADAQYNLGNCYCNGNGVTKDYGEAVKWLRKAADQNDADAQLKLGVCYANGQGVPKDESEGVKWYRKAADQNEADAQDMLGLCYFNGQGLSKDYSEAVKWYRKSADQNEADAQYNLGNCYCNGNGVTKDYGEAVKWLRKAADQNDADAQLKLGVCYANGQGVPKDESEGVKWYRKAADQNHAEAQYSLGGCYESGQGVTKDESEAVKWYRKAADQNFAKAQSFLGICYFKGKGVPKDYLMAYKWQLLAAAQDFEDAKKGVAGLESAMTKEQIAEGQKLVRDFKPQVTPSAGDLR